MSSRVPLAVALVVGFGAGLVVDLIWPNTVYGYQVIATAVAIVVALVAVVLRGRFPIGVSFAVPGAVGLVAGMAAGLALFAAPVTTGAGTVEVHLDRPTELVASGPATCWLDPEDAGAGITTAFDGTDLDLGDERGLGVSIWTDGDRRIEFTVTSVLGDGSPTSTTMVPGPDSDLEWSGTATAGSVVFDGLVLSEFSEQREPIDLAGTLTWTCEATD